MCGLVAVISKMQYGFNKEQVDVFDNLLYVDALRGMDSTGVFMVDRDGTMELAKEASAAHDFRKHNEYQKLKTVAISRGTALIGHNRSATKGTITDENAHPFVVDDRITLVHNGTLFGDHKKLANTEVDSHAIAHIIHQKGDDVQAALQELSGAYALIWHDFKNKTINFVRNSQRPLHFFETDNAWYWASEANMLYWIMARYNIKPKEPISSLKEGVLVTYKQENNRWTIDSKDITLVKPSPPSKNYSYLDGYDGYMGGNNALANGYWGEDEDYQISPAVSNVLALPNKKHVPTPSSHDEYELVKNEENLAKQLDIAFGWQRFGTLSAHISTNSQQVASFFEYFEACKGDPAGGWYAYALMQEEPDFIIKTFIPAIMGENQVMNMCLNNRTAKFHITTKVYKTYTGKDSRIGDGYGIFNSDSYEVVPSQVETLENSVV